MLESIVKKFCETVGIDRKWADKVVIYDYEQLEKSNFKDPSKYYILNAFGDRVYFKTRIKSKARQWCDEIYGKGKYVIREVIRAEVR